MPYLVQGGLRFDDTTGKAKAATVYSGLAPEESLKEMVQIGH